MAVDGQMYSVDAKITDLVEKHLQKKKRLEWEGRVRAVSRNEKGEDEGLNMLPHLFRSVFWEFFL
jgi:hypothetical protein